MKKIREVAKEADLFSTDITLTDQNDTDYSSLTSLIATLALLGLFGYVFIDKFISMVNRSQVRSQYLAFQESTPTNLQATRTISCLQQGQQTFIGLGDGHRPHHMIEVLRHRYKDSVEGQPDSRLDIDNNFGTVPGQPMGQTWQPNSIALGHKKPWSRTVSSGQYKPPTRRQSNLYSIPVPQNHIQELFGCGLSNTAQIDSFLLSEDYLVTLYMLDSLINPDDRAPVSYFINDDLSTTFNLRYGIDASVLIQNYSIKTDNSVMLLQDIEKLSINEPPLILSTYIQTPATDPLASIILRHQNDPHLLEDR